MEKGCAASGRDSKMFLHSAKGNRNLLSYPLKNNRGRVVSERVENDTQDKSDV